MFCRLSVLLSLQVTYGKFVCFSGNDCYHKNVFAFLMFSVKKAFKAQKPELLN